MKETVETNDRIEFKERTSTGLRVFLFVVGLLPWFAPYELLIKPGWNGFHWLTIFFVVISLGAIVVSFGFIGGAIFGMNQTLTFNSQTRTITHAYETAVTSLREKRYAFRDVNKIEISTHDWDTGPSTYGLKITWVCFK
ncbi:MAG: hypothetical protein HZB19_09590 [Chloroflexi bacterium]|nr:hypothetical protein [Chloroflexota bacterium]